MLLTSWIVFAQLLVAHLVVTSLYHSIVFREPTRDYSIGIVPISLLLYAKYHILGWITCFALFEKINKEKFVINYSNMQTRKKLMQLLDALDSPVTIVAWDGKILFSNH